MRPPSAREQLNGHVEASGEPKGGDHSKATRRQRATERPTPDGSPARVVAGGLAFHAGTLPCAWIHSRQDPRSGVVPPRKRSLEGCVLAWNAKTTADVRGGLRASPRGPSWPPSPSASSPRGRMSRAHMTRPALTPMLHAPGPVSASSPKLSSTSASSWKVRVCEPKELASRGVRRRPRRTALPARGPGVPIAREPKRRVRRASG